LSGDWSLCTLFTGRLSLSDVVSMNDLFGFSFFMSMLRVDRGSSVVSLLRFVSIHFIKNARCNEL